MMTKQKATLALTAILILGIGAGCKKKIPPPPPQAPAPVPEAPAAAKPNIAYFTAEPSTVTVGQPSSLRWSVTDATSVNIDSGIGDVSPNGRRGVYPTATTTYHLVATGPGGTSAADATVTVSTPPPPAQAAPSTGQPTIQEILAKQVQDIHFEYDKSEIRGEDQAILQGDASALKTVFQMDPNFVVTIEGHCDERGSAEYNLGLGDRRASTTKDALVALGVPGDKLKTISYGKERPLCTEPTEDCYARNRRAHFSGAQ